MPVAALEVHPELRFLLAPQRRVDRFEVAAGETDTVGHVVQMVGVPLTEVGALRMDGQPVDPSARVPAADRQVTLVVPPRPRPQATGTDPPRFLLDVHLGRLARRLRLLGVDAAYDTEAHDDQLVRRAVQERRLLLTRDRGLLSRTALPEGALVRGDRVEDQLDDLLERFVPPLAPWSRCVRCNGILQAVPREDVVDNLEPGTRRTYRQFSRCRSCGQAYWRGAHSRRLQDLITRAETVRARVSARPWR